MGKLLSLQQAADKLGVTRQTITNWLKTGILQDAGVNRITRIDEDAITKFSLSLKNLAATERRIMEGQKEADQLWRETKKKLTDIRRSYGIINKIGENSIHTNVIHAVLKVAWNNNLIRKCEYAVLDRIVSGETVDALAEYYSLTRASIFLIAGKGVRKIEKMHDYNSLHIQLGEAKEKILAAEELIRCQQKEIDCLKERLGEKTQDEETQPENVEETIGKVKEKMNLLNTYLCEMNFSVRAFNCFKTAGIDTLGDLVQMKKDEILRVRNLGLGTFNEITDQLESMNLSLGMNVNEYIQRKE